MHGSIANTTSVQACCVTSLVRAQPPPVADNAVNRGSAGSTGDDRDDPVCPIPRAMRAGRSRASFLRRIPATRWTDDDPNSCEHRRTRVFAILPPMREARRGTPALRRGSPARGRACRSVPELRLQPHRQPQRAMSGVRDTDRGRAGMRRRSWTRRVLKWVGTWTIVLLISFSREILTN